MKKKDHKALGFFLLYSNCSKTVFSTGFHQRLFVLGCISPDFIPFTYLRGFTKSHAMLGHNAKYSAKHIHRCLNRFQKRGVRHWWDVFRLGTLMHYIADSFTFPHAERYNGDMNSHRQYEIALHSHFAKYLVHQKKNTEHKTESLSAFFVQNRRAYEQGESSFEKDCKYIVEVCHKIFERICLDKISCEKV